MTARRLTGDEAIVIQRHASWEHRLLGDAPSSDLNSIALRHADRTELLTSLLEFLGMWRQYPDKVTEEMIRSGIGPNAGYVPGQLPEAPAHTTP